MTYLVDQRKNKFFLVSIIITALVVSIPLLSSHFLHPLHYFHIAIHEAGFILAVFLFGITLIAYQQTKIIRMLFSASAFGVLALGQLVYIFEKDGIDAMAELESTGEGHFDLAILIMTALFAAGIFYKR
jgi:hypothetical protein